MLRPCGPDPWIGVRAQPLDELVAEALCEMGVAHGDYDAPVPHPLLDLADRDPPHHGVGCKGVTQLVVGDRSHADLFGDDVVMVELKVAKKYNASDEAQLLNELKATGIKVGLLLNFGEAKVEFKRMVY